MLPTVDDYSLLDFPFLFDPAVSHAPFIQVLLTNLETLCFQCKVRVLHIDAVMQMRQEYQDALVHQAVSRDVLQWHDYIVQISLFAGSSTGSTVVRRQVCVDYCTVFVFMVTMFD